MLFNILDFILHYYILQHIFSIYLVIIAILSKSQGREQVNRTSIDYSKLDNIFLNCSERKKIHNLYRKNVKNLKFKDYKSGPLRKVFFLSFEKETGRFYMKNWIQIVFLSPCYSGTFLPFSLSEYVSKKHICVYKKQNLQTGRGAKFSAKNASFFFTCSLN